MKENLSDKHVVLIFAVLVTLGSKDPQYQHTVCGITEMFAIDNTCIKMVFHN